MTMTRDEHRAEALRLADRARQFEPVAHPARVAFIAEAQLHATLALSAPTPAPRKRAARKTTTSKETSK